MLKVAGTPRATFDAEHETVPLVAPATGALQLYPAGVVTDTKLMPAGIASFIVTLPMSGPLFVTVTSNCTSLPGSGCGLGAVLETVKSLDVTSAAIGSDGSRQKIAHRTRDMGLLLRR